MFFNMLMRCMSVLNHKLFTSLNLINTFGNLFTCLAQTSSIGFWLFYYKNSVPTCIHVSIMPTRIGNEMAASNNVDPYAMPSYPASH